MRFSILILILLYVSSGITQAQDSNTDYTRWSLPEGATMRIGKGTITGRNPIALSPDGSRLAVASTIGIWIYDTATSKEIALLTGHTGRVYSVAFSPDGKTIASGSEDTTIRMWDVKTGKHRGTLKGHVEAVSLVLFLSDGETLVSGSWDDTIRLWNLRTGQLSATLSGHSGGVHSIAVSPDGRMLASGGWQKNMLWDAKTGKHLDTFIENAHGITNVTFSPDGKTLASWRSRYDRGIPRSRENEVPTIRLWDIKSRKHRTLPKLNNDPVPFPSPLRPRLATKSHLEQGYCVAFSPDGKRLADGMGRLWNIETGKTITLFRRGNHDPFTVTYLDPSMVVYHPDGQTFAGTIKKSVQLWDAKTGKHKAYLTTPTVPTYTISNIVFSADGQTLVGYNWGEFWIWNMETRQSKAPLMQHGYTGDTVIFLGNGEIIASWGDDKIRLWDTKTGDLRTDPLPQHSPVFSPDGETLAVQQPKMIELWDTKTSVIRARARFPNELEDLSYIIFSPDSQVLVGVSKNGTILIWDVNTGETKQNLITQIQNPRAIYLLFDGKTLISHSQNGAVQLWDLNSGKLQETLTKDTEGIYSIALSPNRQVLGAKSYDGKILLWNMKTGVLQTTLNGNPNSSIVELSWDGKTLVTRRQDNTMLLWDVETGTLHTTITQHPSGWFAAKLSPDGKTLATRGKDNTIRLWNAETGILHTTLTGHTDLIKSLSFSPDGFTLASCSEDNVILLWNLKQ